MTKEESKIIVEAFFNKETLTQEKLDKLEHPDCLLMTIAIGESEWFKQAVRNALKA